MTNISPSQKKNNSVPTSNSVYKRNIPILAGSAFFIGGAYTIYNSLFQPLVLSLGGSIAIVGAMVSISELAMFLPMLLFGEYSDAVGRRRPMIIASLLLIIAGFFFIIAPQWLFLTIPVLLTGIAFSINQPAVNAATAEAAPGSQRGRAFAYRSAARLMAGVVVSILGIAFLQRGAIQNAFLLFFIFAIINLGLIYSTFRESLRTPRPGSNIIKKIRQNWAIHPKLKPLYFYIIVTDTFSFGIGWHLIYGLLADFQGVSSQTILLYTLMSSLAGGIVLFSIVGRVVDRTRKWSIVLSDSIAVPSVLLCALKPGELTYPIVFILMGIASSFWGPAVQSFIVDHVSPDRTAAEFGKIWGFRGVIIIFPPIIGGLLAESYGYSAPLLVNFFVGLISISVVILFLDRKVSFSK